MNNLAKTMAIMGVVLATGIGLAVLTPTQASAVSASSASSGINGDQAVATASSDPVFGTDTAGAGAGPAPQCQSASFFVSTTLCQ